MSNYNKKEEVWKPIKGYEGYYEVSTFGRVRSLDRITKRKDGALVKKKGRVLKHGTARGYHVVRLMAEGNDNMRYVHRLVAEMFIPNPLNKPEVNHISENKDDNSVWNLEWVTRSENMRSGTVQDRINEQREKSVIVESIRTKEKWKYDSLKEASEAFNANLPTVVECCQGKRNMHKGYFWCYSDDYETVSKKWTDEYRMKIYPIIIQYDLKGNELHRFNSITEAAEFNGFNRSGIDKCLRGELKQTHGYIFRYKSLES